MDNLNIVSINQINAQIKLAEMWKALNIVNYPINIRKFIPENKTNKVHQKLAES